MPKKKSAVSSWEELLGEKKQNVLTAEEIERTEAPKYRTTVTVNADWIAYDMEKKSIKAKGHLKISTPEHSRR